MTKKRKKIFAISAISLLFIMLIVFVCGIIASKKVELETFDYFSDNNADKNIKIAHLSDVHFKDKNEKHDEIIEKLKNKKVDVIALTGDIIDGNSTRENIDELAVFFRKLNEISPCYAVLGNHEMNNKNLKYYKKILTKNNIYLLENEIKEVQIKNRKINLIGLIENNEYVEDFTYTNLKGEFSENNTSIMLVHKPSEKYVLACEKEIIPKVILTGHNHGGQFQIFNRGIISPSGLFPKYFDGEYDYSKNTKIIVSRGLGNSVFNLRLFNSFHLPIIII